MLCIESSSASWHLSSIVHDAEQAISLKILQWVMGLRYGDMLITHRNGCSGKIILGLSKLRALNDDLIKPWKGCEAISTLKQGA